MAALPLAKLGALTIKTLSKPIANIIKSRAKNHPMFKQICIDVGETNNITTYYFNKLVRNQHIKYQPIDTNFAINKGSEILGELVVYFIGGVLLIEEYIRTSRATAKTKQQTLNRIDQLEINVNVLLQQKSIVKD